MPWLACMIGQEKTKAANRPSNLQFSFHYTALRWNTSLKLAKQWNLKAKVESKMQVICKIYTCKVESISFCLKLAFAYILVTEKTEWM